ncbi:PorP/SprF family type IX secretion system membrane protein [Imperialibacter roseus]|uniref:PorP/SprF family type IX secretion system membrane protein n=1 Tax=Imperialibacter roseus TaxID=1324217 RepID=A0ABZ0IV26_9BACT|nr:PorP/SprF family type IX secretion system membrane protein [Imperialibacter roseus]WOK08228.1 PorP/SprF family type IX secretion system membrane protein [Imperialibacter roseus]
MKFKLLALIALLSLCIGKAYSQGGIFLSQYYQNLPGFNPGLTGAADFLDIRTGTRQQWVGFEGAPKTYFVSANGAIKPKVNPYRKNSLRMSESAEAQLPSSGASRLKWGLGGYVLKQEQGPFDQMQSVVNVASHIAVAERTYLSLGIATGISNYRVNLSEVVVADQVNDATYNRFMANGFNNTYATLSTGVAIYSDLFYAGISALQLSRTLLNGNDMLNKGGNNQIFHMVGGYRLYFRKFDVIPNINVRFETNQPMVVDLGARLRYNKLIFAGLSYRNDQSVIALLGIDITDKINFSYSLESRVGNASDVSNGSHEIMLGLKLFNHNRFSPLW